jgi:hypothetical protein
VDTPQKLPRIRRKTFYVTALPFGIDGVVCQRRFARTAQPRNHGKRVARNIDVDIFQVIDPGAFDNDGIVQFLMDGNNMMVQTYNSTANLRFFLDAGKKILFYIWL